MPSVRPVDRVDQQLATLVQMQRETGDQIEAVRQDIHRLEAHELTLVTTYAGRERRIDTLLDERNAGAQDPVAY